MEDRSRSSAPPTDSRLHAEWAGLSARKEETLPLRRILAAWIGEPSAGDSALQGGPALWLACGPRGCGKSSFLRTAALELARQSPPDRLRLAGIDPGGRELAVLESLPHMHLDLATSVSHAESILEWLADEAAWRLDHGVRRPAIVLLAEVRGGRTAENGPSGWGRLGQALAHGAQVGLHAILAWDGVPWGPKGDERFGYRVPAGVALPGTPERPARVWDIRLGESRLRAIVPWYGVRDLDAATRDIRLQHLCAWRQPSQPVSIGTWIGGVK